MKIVEKKPGHDEKLAKLKVQMSNPLLFAGRLQRNATTTVRSA